MMLSIDVLGGPGYTPDRARAVPDLSLALGPTPTITGNFVHSLAVEPNMGAHVCLAWRV
jgi:hypothetical protein